MGVLDAFGSLASALLAGVVMLASTAIVAGGVGFAAPEEPA